MRLWGDDHGGRQIGQPLTGNRDVELTVSRGKIGMRPREVFALLLDDIRLDAS